MALGAVILTTGAHRAAGLTSLLSPAGSVTAGQRMIAAFQRVGVEQIWLVTGPENRRAERSFAGNGVFFLHQEPAAQTAEQALRFALSHLPAYLDRLFITCGDTPFCLPQTLMQLMEYDADAVRPYFGETPGWPIFATRKMLQKSVNPLSPDHISRVPTDDPGVLPGLPGDGQIDRHGNELERPVLNLEITRGVSFYDKRLSALLHLVDETQSVRDACRIMQISYSVAWQMLNRAEEVTGFPLVTRKRGGPAGQGSFLTERGRKLMDAYDAFSAEIEALAERRYHALFGGMIK